jgi:hypothetical protein
MIWMLNWRCTPIVGASAVREAAGCSGCGARRILAHACCRASLLGPVLDDQPGQSPELGDAARDDDQTACDRDGGDQQVALADWPADTLQLEAQAGIPDTEAA